MRFPIKLLPLSVALAVPAALAQDQLVLEEVVVTAQKRAQTLQEVPVAVSAFDGDMLERNNISDTNDLAVLTPGVSGATSDSFSDNLAIRGIATNDYGIGGDPSIAVFKNGVWSGRNGGALSAFYDMERAEIVKGPQATLFGRNAIAGAISTHTRKPEQEFSGRVGLGVAQRNEYTASAMINLPITDQLASRFNLHRETEGDYIDNLAGGDAIGGREITAARASFRYETDALSVDWVNDYESRKGSPVPYISTELNAAKNTIASDMYAAGRGLDQSDIFNSSINATLEVTDSVSISSITGYNQFDFDYAEDYDGIPRRTSEFTFNVSDSYASQELRLDYNANGNIYWFAGVSAYKETIHSNADYPYDEETNCADLANYGLGFDGGCADIFGSAGIADKHEVAQHKVSNTGASAFGDVTWDISDRLSLIGGLRYTRDKKAMQLNIVQDANSAIGNFYALPNVTDGWVDGDETWSKTTGRLVASYDLTGDINAYLSYSQGYKSGGFQTFGGVLVDENDDFSQVVAPKSYAPEIVDSYEIGFKGRVFDDRLELNVAAFQFIYTDLQLLYFTDSGRQIVDNVGEVLGRGLELDGRWLATENLELAFSVGYGKSRYSDATELLEKGICTNCADKTLPNTPEWSGALFATYSKDVSLGSWYTSLEYTYEGSRASDPDHVAVIDAWQNVNLRTGLDTERWELSLWIENLANENHFQDAYPASLWGPNVNIWPSKPRTVGVNFNYHLN